MSVMVEHVPGLGYFVYIFDKWFYANNLYEMSRRLGKLGFQVVHVLGRNS